MPCIYLFHDSLANDSDSDLEIEDPSPRIIQYYQKLKAACIIDVADVSDKTEIQKQINPVFFYFEMHKDSYQMTPELENDYEHMITILISKGYLTRHYLSSPHFFDSAPEVNVGFSTTFL